MTSSEMIPLLMEAADQIRLFHWQTTSYAEHKVLGQVYDDISDATDTLAESMIGVDGVKPKLAGTLELSDYTAGAPQKYLTTLASQLEAWKDLPSDILNMRDDLLGKIHHALGLLTFG